MAQQLAPSWPDPISEGLVAWYDVGCFLGSRRIPNAVPDQREGPLTFVDQGYGPGPQRFRRGGVFLDNTDSGTELATIAEITGTSIWRRSVSDATFLAALTLEDYTSGPPVVFHRGGKVASGGGFECSFKKSTQQFQVKAGPGLGSFSTAVGSTTFSADRQAMLTVAIVLDSTRSKNLVLFVNGIEEASLSVSLGATSLAPAILSKSSDAFSAGDEWGGTLLLLACWQRALSAKELAQLHNDPWQWSRPSRVFPIQVPASVVSPTSDRNLTYNRSLAKTASFPVNLASSATFNRTLSKTATYGR